MATSRPAASTASIPGLWWKAATGLLIAFMTFYGFVFVGPAAGFPDPEGARAIFFHVPSAYVCILVLTAGAWHAGRYLNSLRFGPGAGAGPDHSSSAAMEVSFVFGVITLITGMLFSQIEWGLFWSWDPRQTSMLIVCLILAAYMVLRGAVTDADARARLTAVYAVVSYLPAIFLLIVMPRIVTTLHGAANETVIGGLLTGGYRVVMYGMALPAFLMLSIWLRQLRIRAARLESRGA